jgi:hypothetical protein
LESYHPYLLPQEVSKTPITLGTYGSLPKIKKGRFGSLNPLGLNKNTTSMKDMVYKRIKILLNAKYLRLVSNSMVKSLLTLDDE